MRSRGRYEKTDMQLCRHFHIAWQLRKFCSSLQGTGQGSAANPYERLFRFQSFLESWMNQHQPRLRRLNQVRRRQEDQSPLLGRQTIRHSPLPRAPRRRRLAWSASQSVSQSSCRYLAFQKCPSARPSVRPSDRPSNNRPSIERPMVDGRMSALAPNTADLADSLPPSLSRCRYISLSPPSEESSNYSVGPNGRTDGRRSRPASQTFGANERTNERANPALYSIPSSLPFPSSPFSICSCRRSLAPLSPNERERELRSRGDL